MKNIEPFYMYAMRKSIHNKQILYPVPINSGTYCIEIDYNGWVHMFNEEYKQKARWKKDKIWHKELYKIYTVLYLIENNRKMKNILEEAIDIVYKRDTQKEKDYGPFEDSMKDAAKIMTILTGKNITTRDFYKAMVSLKLARLKHSDRHDTYLDLVAYIASMSELKNDKQLIPKEFGND